VQGIRIQTHYTPGEPLRLVARRSLSDWLWSRFQVDTRALAAFRIALALVTLYDLASRELQLLHYYTNTGPFLPSAPYLSLYSLSNHPLVVQLLFSLHALFALMLLLGYRTRLAAFACLVLTISLAARNPLLATTGDSLLIWLLFWSLFLPLGAKASIDGLTSRGQPTPNSVCSVASLALLLQIALMYWSITLARIGPGWTSHFTAAHAFLLSPLGTPLGHSVARLITFTRLLTAGTLLLESVGPLLALVGSIRVRITIAILFIAFHLAQSAALYLSIFPFVCIAAWLAVIPWPAWNTLATFPPTERIAHTWSRFLARLTSLLDRLSPTSPLIAHRGWRWTLNDPQTIFVSIALAYVILVNAVSSFPPRLTPFVGPLAHLPSLHQSWPLLDLPPKVSLSLTIDAILPDGPPIPLFREPVDPVASMRLLYPPQNSRLVIAHQRLITRALAGDPTDLVAFAHWHRHHWEEQISSPAHINHLIAVADSEQIRPLNAVSNDWLPRRERHSLYTWTEPTPGIPETTTSPSVP
jgi:hypothetical protein